MTKETRPHPDHERLLLLVDGELLADERAVMTKHVEACWQCRHELRTIEQTIADAMEYRRQRNERLPMPPEPWSDLSRQFAAIDAAVAPQSWWQAAMERAGQLLRTPRFAIPVVGMAAVAATVVWNGGLWTEQTTPRVTDDPVAVVATAPRETVPIATPDRPKETPVPSSAVPAAAVPDADELLSAAVRVHGTLHELKADLGEPVEVVRTAEAVEVRGFGLDPAKAREIQAVLANVPHVRLVLNAKGQGSAAGAVTRVVIQPGVSPLQEQLQQRLGSASAVDEWITAAVDDLDDLMVRAHALRRLDEAFPAGTLAGAGAEMVAEIRRDHSQAMAAANAKLQRELSAVFGQNVSADAGATGYFEAARGLEVAVGELAGATATRAEGDLAGRIAASLRSVDAAVRRLSRAN